MRSFKNAVLIGVGMLGSGAFLWLYAQDRPTFRIKVDMVVLSFTVTNSKGNYINGLKPSDFRVTEDGIVQRINTFGEGRGVSGTVRIWKAMPLFEDAKRKMATIPIPSGEFLPPIPKTKYPVDAMKRIVLTEDFDLEQYHIVTRRFDVFILPLRLL